MNWKVFYISQFFVEWKRGREKDNLNSSGTTAKKSFTGLNRHDSHAMTETLGN
jgi:hypothetical protein